MSDDPIQRPARVIVPPPVTFKWSPDATAFAVSLWTKATPAADVAAAVNRRFDTDFSRKSLIAKMHRMGLSHSGPSIPSAFTAGGKGKSKPAPKPKAPRKPKPIPVAVAVVAKPTAAPRPAVPMALPESRRVAIHDLRIGHCRYIAGNPRVDSTACGHKAVLGSSWCEAHRVLCTAVSRPRAVGSGSYRRAA